MRHFVRSDYPTPCSYPIARLLSLWRSQATTLWHNRCRERRPSTPSRNAAADSSRLANPPIFTANQAAVFGGYLRFSLLMIDQEQKFAKRDGAQVRSSCWAGANSQSRFQSPPVRAITFGPLLLA